MLKSISLENYKCFKDETEIKIAPLTVLCGVNSSGKSSILKSLLMLKQSYESESSTQALSFNGKWVDNGFFNDVVYHNEPITEKNENEYSTFSIRNTFIINPANKNSKSTDAVSFRELRKIYYRFPKIKSFQISIMLTVNRSKQNNANAFSKYIEDNNVSYYSICLCAYDSHNNEITGTDGEIVLQNIIDSDKEYDLTWRNIPCSKNPSSKKESPYHCTCYFSGLQVSNIYKEGMTDNDRYVLPSLLEIFKICALQYEGIQFIAPLRHVPERNYFIKGNVESVGISGEDTPYLLAKLNEKPLITDMDCLWTDNIPSYFKVSSSTYDKVIGNWIQHFNLGDLKIRGDGGNVSINLSGHNISDTGFGVSQILPIITQGIIMQKDQTLLLEQPEIHLHPKMQMDMADFLIQLAMTRRNVIVETHSDHIINRLVRRIMETKGYNNDVSKCVKIYFLNYENELNRVVIDRIKVSKYNGIINAKENFFTQFAAETESILSLSYKNLEQNSFQYDENEEEL